MRHVPKAPMHPLSLCSSREEEYFEREAVLGRDTSSVFPTEAKKANALDPEALKAAIGGDRKFISATEVGLKLCNVQIQLGLLMTTATVKAC